MSAFLDRYHDVHHVGTTVDLINCPVCQDEFTAWFEAETQYVPEDRLEDREAPHDLRGLVDHRY